MKRLLLLAGVFLLALVPASLARADAEQEVDSALNASLNWIGQIDSGAYDDSYKFGGDAFRDKVPADQWSNILKTLRTPMGAVTSRKQISHIFKPNGFEGTSGEFMVITYDTSFSKQPNATEIVVLRWEGGKWRGAGYNAGPKPSDEAIAEGQPNSSSTEVNTEMHVKPEPK